MGVSLPTKKKPPSRQIFQKRLQRVGDSAQHLGGVGDRVGNRAGFPAGPGFGGRTPAFAVCGQDRGPGGNNLFVPAAGVGDSGGPGGPALKQLPGILFQGPGQLGIDAHPGGAGGDVDAAVQFRRRAHQELPAQLFLRRFAPFRAKVQVAVHGSVEFIDDGRDAVGLKGDDIAGADDFALQHAGALIEFHLGRIAFVFQHGRNDIKK